MRTSHKLVPISGLTAVMLMTPCATAQVTTRVSLDSMGMQANSGSDTPALSADGRTVAFQSYASNLVPGDTNAGWDVFVRDRQTGQTRRASVDSAGMEGNNWSLQPAISADGRYVAFQSYATNLVAGDTNGWPDVFVHDLQTGQTSRVSVDSTGQQGIAASEDPEISSDGRYVVFSSGSSDLVPGDTNQRSDIFVHDRQTGQTTRVSVDSAGVQGNDNSLYAAISSDGRIVAFTSLATNLVPLDTNRLYDVFVHDRQTGQTTRVSVDSTGVQSNGISGGPSISADDRYVAFNSSASNLVAGDTNNVSDVFLHDRQTGLVARVGLGPGGAQGNGHSYRPSLSADSRIVAFRSGANNLVAGDTNNDYDVFVHDRSTGLTSRISVDSSGAQGDSGSDYPSASSDGRYVAFQSYSDNLIAGDTNANADVFVHDRAGSTLSRSGTCPGPMSFTASGMTPGGTTAFVWGTAGSFTIPAGRPCAGALLDLLPLFMPPPGYVLVPADGSGSAVFSTSVPPAACGLVLLQAMDLASCVTTNTVLL